MKISIITVCYNSESTIKNTIDSVIAQDYQNIEYIIVDGNSTDTTMQIINKYRNKISKIISEKDDGIYYALNKGIDIATGEIIGILHSDDFYPNNHIISKVINEFITKKSQSVYGDLEYVAKQNANKVLRYWRSGKYSHELFLKGWMPPHPSFFVKKDCYQQYGKFNTKLTSSADYELMLRLLYKNKISTHYIPEVLVKMYVGGKSNVSLMNRIKANKEDRLAWKINGLKPTAFTLFMKPLSKFSQFIK